MTATAKQGDLIQDVTAAKRSLRGLDWMNFFMADVQMAVGAFVASYLAAGRQWDAAQVGLVVAAQNIATMLAQPAAGALVDNSNRKNWLAAGAGAIVGAGCIAILMGRSTIAEAAIQIVIGVASAIFPPAIAALSLGLVGGSKLPRRVGRNEAWNHGGKVSLAVAAALAGTRLGPEWIF